MYSGEEFGFPPGSWYSPVGSAVQPDNHPCATGKARVEVGTGWKSPHHLPFYAIRGVVVCVDASIYVTPASAPATEVAASSSPSQDAGAPTDAPSPTSPPSNTPTEVETSSFPTPGLTDPPPTSPDASPPGATPAEDSPADGEVSPKHTPTPVTGTESQGWGGCDHGAARGFPLHTLLLAFGCLMRRGIGARRV